MSRLYRCRPPERGRTLEDTGKPFRDTKGPGSERSKQFCRFEVNLLVTRGTRGHGSKQYWSVNNEGENHATVARYSWQLGDRRCRCRLDDRGQRLRIVLSCLLKTLQHAIKLFVGKFATSIAFLEDFDR